MIALVLKDIASARRVLILTVLLSIGICVYAVYEKEYLMIPAICGIIPLMLSSVNYGYDARSNFEQMAFSMPIKRNSYILSRLFFPILAGVIGGVSFCVVLVIESTLSTGMITLISVLTLLAIVLISTIQLPFILKFGEEKGRLVMVITYFLLFKFLSTIKGLVASVSGFFLSLSQYPVYVIGLGVIAVLLFIIVISINISMALLENKEY